jgi:hypothetical protein
MTESRRTDRPTPKMIRLYHELSRRLGGEPKDLWVYDPAALPQPHSEKLRLHNVMVWPADRRCDVTSFNTLGMSDRRMKGADYFAELHLGVRARLKKKDREAVARFLVNVAEYPFHNDLKLDWWEVVSRPGTIPFFPGCRHLLLHPSLAVKGFDRIDDPDGPVKLLYVVPITPMERHLMVDHGREAFIRHAKTEGLDLCKDRRDEDRWYAEEI